MQINIQLIKIKKTNMNQKNLLVLLISFILLSSIIGQTKVNPVIADKLQASQFAKMNGYVGEKLDLSYTNRILAQDFERLVAPFRNRTETKCWQSEFWGKWFTSAVLAYKYRPEPQLKLVLDKAVAGLLSTQTPDGYIGNYADKNHLEEWDIWGRKYCMLGLLAYYDISNDKKSLLAVRKLADHLIKELADKNALIVRQGNHRGMAATSVLEPICLLYANTGDKRYLDFAQEIARQWETPIGTQLISKAKIDVSRRFPLPENWWGYDQGQKAYEMMSCYEGLLELYRLTGKAEYKEAVINTWQNILDTEINIVGSGASLECWFGGKKLQALPNKHYQETCVTATWIKLSQQLLRLTGEAKYADAIEQTYYNALLGAMSPDGSNWAKYTPLSGKRIAGEDQCEMGLNCCVASGPRALFTIPLTSVMTIKEGIQVNFFGDGIYSLQTPKKQKVELVQETDYPKSGRIRLKIKLQKPENMSLSIRIPKWSSESSVMINGDTLKGVVQDGYISIKRNWKVEDLIDINLDMQARIVHLGDFPEYLAIVKGPIVLSRDSRLLGPDIEEIIKPIADKDSFLKYEPVQQKNPEVWMEFKFSFVSESIKEDIIFCDYSSAGNSKNGNPQYKVWLPQYYDMKKWLK